MKVQRVAAKAWRFSREFTVPAEPLAQRKVILRLEDCDTFATVSVNGRKVGRASDRFARWDFDVKDAFRVGRKGGGVTFNANNRALFMKGADWIPCEGTFEGDSAARTTTWSGKPSASSVAGFCKVEVLR